MGSPRSVGAVLSGAARRREATKAPGRDARRRVNNRAAVLDCARLLEKTLNALASGRLPALPLDPDFHIIKHCMSLSQGDFHHHRDFPSSTFCQLGRDIGPGRLRTRAVEAAYSFSRRGGLHRPARDEVVGSLDQCDGYIAMAARQARVLQAERVALPSELQPVPLPAVLPEAIAAVYMSPALCLHPDHITRLGRKARTCFKGGDAANWARLVQRLNAAGMVDFMEVPPQVVCGSFGVDKTDGSLRFIVDCRETNNIFVAPPSPNLPNPGSYAKIPAWVTCVAKGDLSNYFHSLLLPAWMRTYFGLRRVRAQAVGLPGDGWVYPVCRTVPMGWSHAPYVAQMVHIEVLGRAGGPAVVDLREAGAVDSPVPAAVVYRLVYIDDLILLGASPDAVNEALDAALAAYRAAGLQVKLSKVFRAADEMETLGVVFNAKKHSYYVSGKKMAALVACTRDLCALDSKVLVSAVRSVLGRWLWASLVRRPVLAIMHHVFRFTRLTTRRAHLWASVRQELLTLCALAPVMYGTTAEWAPVVGATDASSSGYGVCVTHVPLNVVREVANCTETRGEAVFVHGPAPPAEQGGARMVRDERVDSWTMAQHWVTTLAGAWRGRGHINELEVISSILGLRWLARQPKKCASRVVFLSDSQVAVGALSKGRSSAIPLISLLRRFAGISLAADIQAAFAWVSTHCNPADAPSRLYRHRAAKSARGRHGDGRA